MIKVYFHLQNLPDFSQGKNIPVSTFRNVEYQQHELVEIQVPIDQFKYLSPNHAKGEGYNPAFVQGYIKNKPYTEGE